MTRHRRKQELQKTVLKHLTWRGMPGMFVFHYPAGGWRSPIEAAIFQSLGVVAGIPDILIIRAGHVFALELKTAHGRLTTTQIETQTRLRAAGAEVATASNSTTRSSSSPSGDCCGLTFPLGERHDQARPYK